MVCVCPREVRHQLGAEAQIKESAHLHAVHIVRVVHVVHHRVRVPRDPDSAVVRGPSNIGVGLALQTEAGEERHALAAVRRIRVVNRVNVSGGPSALLDEGPVVEAHKERVRVPVDLLVKNMAAVREARTA
jgi:hypothetical protein